MKKRTKKNENTPPPLCVAVGLSVKEGAWCVGIWHKWRKLEQCLSNYLWGSPRLLFYLCGMNN